MVKKIDSLGRIVIPKEIRKEMKLNAGDSLHFCFDPQKKHVLLKKDFPSCSICAARSDLIKKNGICLCADCLKKIQGLIK